MQIDRIRGRHRRKIAGAILAALKEARSYVDHGALVSAIEQHHTQLIGSCLIPSVAAMKASLDKSFAKVAVPLFVDAANYEVSHIHSQKAMRAAAFGVSAELTFDHDSPEAIAWAREASSELIVGITEESRQAIQVVMERAFVEHIPPVQAAQLIEPLIGLDSGRAEAVLNLKDTILENPGNRVYAGKVPIRVPESGFSKSALQAKLTDYADRLLRQRATTIARTETAQASADGQHAMWKKALKEGYLDKDHDERKWIAGKDACEKICAELDGQHAALDGSYELDGVSYEGSDAHPNCECTEGLTSVNHNELEAMGGKGSGDFKHKGRPGEVGGSGEGAGLSWVETPKEIKAFDKKYKDDKGTHQTAIGIVDKDVVSVVNLHGNDSHEYDHGDYWPEQNRASGSTERFRYDHQAVFWLEKPSKESFFKVEDYFAEKGWEIKEHRETPHMEKDKFTVKDLKSAGGAGSGNFGHRGRLGEVGGAAEKFEVAEILGYTRNGDPIYAREEEE